MKRKPEKVEAIGTLLFETTEGRGIMMEAKGAASDNNGSLYIILSVNEEEEKRRHPFPERFLGVRIEVEYLPKTQLKGEDV